jgi:hypothetical protein
MGKKIIRLTEADIEKLVQQVLSEQTERVLVDKLNDKIKSVMIEKQKEILSDVKVEVDQNGDNLVLKFSSENERPFNITLRPQGRGEYSVAGTFDRNIPSIPLSNFYDEIFKDKDLMRYYEENENIKSQMDELKVPIRMYSDPSVEFKIFVSDNNRKSRRSDDYVKGAQTNLGFFFSNAGAKFGVSRNIILDTEVGGLAVKLGEVNILPPQSPEGETVTPEIASENIKLDLVDVFKFDTIDMKDLSGYQKVLGKFKDDLNAGLTKLSRFKEFLESQNLVVKGFASRDNDPNEKVQGKFSGCRGYGDGTRGQYNLCLSEERAKKVAEDLQEIFNSFNVNVDIKSKGFGESSKFGPAWSKENPTKPEDTQPNRRVTFNIPKYTETVRK